MRVGPLLISLMIRIVLSGFRWTKSLFGIFIFSWNHSTCLKAISDGIVESFNSSLLLVSGFLLQLNRFKYLIIKYYIWFALRLVGARFPYIRIFRSFWPFWVLQHGIYWFWNLLCPLSIALWLCFLFRFEFVVSIIIDWFL